MVALKLKEYVLVIHHLKVLLTKMVIIAHKQMVLLPKAGVPQIKNARLPTNL
jgi:hypothetical protein